MLVAASGFAVASLALAQAPAPAERKVQAALIAPTTAFLPGKPFVVGLRQQIAPHWHTYWINPGDSGEPTRLTWELPPGFTASAIQWPIPEAIRVGPLMNYGYSDRLLLPVTITPPADYDGASVTLKAKAEWLVCEKICIPEDQVVTLTLAKAAPGAALPPSTDATAFETTRRAMPVKLDWPVSATLAGKRITLSVTAPALDRQRIKSAEFFAEKWGAVDHPAPQKLKWTKDGFTLELSGGELASPSQMPHIGGVLVLTEKLDGRDVRQGFSVSAPVKAAAAGTASTPGAVESGGVPDGVGSGIALWQAILFAFLGGAILNLMPCVLPILSLKVMALARHGGGEARRGGIAYLAGVMVSFTVLAALLIGLRMAGEQLGWGFQFQSPTFVLAMIALFFALGLSMSGVFDIGGNLVGAGENLTHRAGLSGSFFTGVLATVAATPCTAPFMGAAIGYALTRPAIETVLVLEALGIGFALPIVLLSFSGAVARLLPKPGAWMETLKQVLAFPLYATVAWLVWVLSIQTGSSGVLAAGVLLVGVGLAAWWLGRPVGSPWLRTGVAAAMALAVFATAMSLTGAPQTTNTAAAPARPGVEMGDAVPYSAQRVAELRRQGKAVFVNFTAAWCISCKVNERIALSTDGFRRGLDQYGITYVKGDWTNKNDEIAQVLRSFGRAGVPLYLLYPADPSAKAVVLPQLLTEAMVLRYFASLKGTSSRPQ